MAFLFEYGGWVEAAKTDDLKNFLESIWRERWLTGTEMEIEESVAMSEFRQPFLEFDGNCIRGRNYSGFVQHGNELIEIYPKVFRDSNCQDKRLMLDHIFYWLQYCRKWQFPFTQANLDTRSIDSFPELIIRLISEQIYSTVASQPLMQYYAVEEALATPRGSINFSRYVNNSLSKSNFHKIECDHEPFVLDNKVNRVIKHCVRLLLRMTRVSETSRVLLETICILDEVEDLPCGMSDIDSITLNTFYGEYLQILESCRLILAQQVYSGNTYDISQWCLLLPMEYIFEDFIAGFLDKHFSGEWKVEYQKSDLNLSDDPPVFNMQHDIFLTGRNRTIIVDAKYKIRKRDFKNDPKKGVSQTDLYQMLSYAYKRGCSETILMYPNISEVCHSPDQFSIKPASPHISPVNVTAMEVPFWSREGVEQVEDRLKEFLDQYLGR